MWRRLADNYRRICTPFWRLSYVVPGAAGLQAMGGEADLTQDRSAPHGQKLIELLLPDVLPRIQ